MRALALPHRASPTAPVLTITLALAVGTAGTPLRELLSAAGGCAMSAKLAGGRERVHRVSR